MTRYPLLADDTPALGPEDAQGAPRHRIIIVTAEILGPVRNGGIATALTGLAEVLAEAGHHVTVLFIDLAGTMQQPDRQDRWAELYGRRGIRLAFLHEEAYRDRSPLALSLQVTSWLAGERADIVHFHDWIGLGHETVRTMRMGQGFVDTLLVIGAHGPSAWAAEGNGLPNDPEQERIERYAIEQADVLIAPSHYLLSWMEARGWQLPKRHYVQQNLLPRGEGTGAPVPRQGLPVRELVFFGRLEPRKGVLLFCDALDRLAANGIFARHDGLKITFLGKSTPIEGMEGRDYVAGRAAGWPVGTAFVSDLDSADALAYLAAPGRLAIIPSLIENSPCTVLECLLGGIPFLAADVGGVAELIAPEDRDQLLFSPSAEALATALTERLAAGAATGRPAIPQEEVRRVWTGWHIRPSRPHQALIARLLLSLRKLLRRK
ncbi:glycosyltransferase family 4 protein [Oceanibaculum indicum]|uniref:Glycosyltransferase involved in cell wall biosynthesis n=1 Tax=Oceanibaculum indicum TaxID=526216 RepID=A0A420WAC1_9PROT|nr:glycosyltransferase family 4 protein [Oceanibaculum indicum]RKQ67925.1 glycosyltransferase involved in cell wall biosynthesis [Oceanibaculum indicum]